MKMNGNAGKDNQKGMRSKKLLPTIWILTVLFGLAGCSAGNASVSGMAGTAAETHSPGAESSEAYSGTQEDGLDNELKAADGLGLLPDGSSLSADCSEKQFYGIMRKILSLKGASPDGYWEELEQMAGENAILRAYAARALYFTACQTDYEADPEIAAERGAFEFGASEANAWCVSHKNKENCLMVDGLSDYPEFADRLIEMDGGWKYEDGKRNTIPTDWTISFCIQQEDPHTGFKVLEIDEDDRFYPFNSLSIGDAVKAAYRLYRSLESGEEEAVYVRVEEAGEMTIPASCYQDNPHNLPDVSTEELPAFQGSGYINKFNSRAYREFSESDIRFLGENGFNYVRLMFGFSTLGAPDYPEDAWLVNEKELEKLDELLCWGMKYGVHVQICMHGQPGRHDMENFVDGESGEYITAENYQSGSLYPTVEEWRLISAYWEMMAKRYENIPNRFLSFDLMNEWSVQEDEVTQFTADWKTVIDRIRAVDADRTLVASFDMGACMNAVESIASQHVAISYHIYSPGRLCHLGASYMQKQYPYLQSAEWPMVYFPCTLREKDESLIIVNEAHAGNMRLYVSASEGNARLKVSADGNILTTLQPEDGLQYDKSWDISLPVQTQKIEITAEQGLVRIGMLQLTGGEKDVTMTPHDVFSTGSDTAGGLTLYARTDGSFANDTNRLYTAEDIYEEYVRPYQRIAEENGVGFMMNEFGIFGGAYLEGDTAYTYYRQMRQMFKKHKIGFALCELNGGQNLKSGEDDFRQFRGNAVSERWMYDYPGEIYRADIFYIDRNLLDSLTE